MSSPGWTVRARTVWSSRAIYQNGILPTGVDAVITAAGVAKATFYRHFPSKNDLIVAWLRDPRARWFDRVRAQAEAEAAGPAEVIPRFFDALADWLETEDYRGCPYLNTTVEITDPSHPARLASIEYLQEVEDYLAEMVASAGYRDSRVLATQLQALVAGSISLAVARGSRDPVQAAGTAALRLFDEAARG